MTDKTRKATQITMITTAIAILGGLGLYQWIGPALLNAHATDPEKFVLKSVYETYIDTHGSERDAIMAGITDKFLSIRDAIEAERRHAQEWRLGQAQVNERILNRLDLLIDRTIPRGHTDAGFPWEEGCLFP